MKQKLPAIMSEFLDRYEIPIEDPKAYGDLMSAFMFCDQTRCCYWWGRLMAKEAHIFRMSDGAVSDLVELMTIVARGLRKD